MSSLLKYDEISSFLEKNCVVTSIVQQVLRNLKANYQNSGKVLDHDLLALSSLFGETLEKALEIVEGNKVTYFHNQSDTVAIYQVQKLLESPDLVCPYQYLKAPLKTASVLGQVNTVSHSKTVLKYLQKLNTKSYKVDSFDGFLKLPEALTFATKVEGKSHKIYRIFPSVNYCPCPSYKYQVSGASQIICKHVLGTIIADAINKKQSIEVTNEHLSDLLLSSISLSN